MKDLKILIVDDSELMRSVAKNIMNINGFEFIVEATNVAEAEKELAKAKVGRKVGLIISDYNMPEKNGIEFLKSVKANKDFAHIPFIIMSTTSDRAIISQAVTLGAIGYIIKPFNSESFEAAVKKALKF